VVSMGRVCFWLCVWGWIVFDLGGLWAGGEILQLGMGSLLESNNVFA
jgi:hypothetical protein